MKKIAPTITPETQKMLNRIHSDSPREGDGKDFLDFIESMRIISLEKSIAPDSVQCRLYQGQALGHAALLKAFNDAWEDR